MNKYFTIRGVLPCSVIAAYRGTDEKNTLEIEIPSEDKSFTKLNIAPNLDVSSIQSTIGCIFGNLAIINNASEILIKVSDNGHLIAWYINKK